MAWFLYDRDLHHERVNYGPKLQELFLFIKLFVATMMEISKYTLFKRGIESDIAFKKVSRDVSQYNLQSGSLLDPLSKNMPRNKRNVSLEIFRTSVCFLSMLYGGTTWCSEQSYQLTHQQRMIQKV